MVGSRGRRARLDVLIRRLEEERFLTVASMCSFLDVSEPTMRRDLVLLEDEGRLRRVRGGAVAMESESPFQVRMNRHGDQKRAIAQAARALIRPGETVAVDVGTTMVHFAQAIADLPCHFVTNGLYTAQALSGGRCEVTVTGGTLRPNEGSMVGPVARRAIRSYVFDAFFMSVGSIGRRGAMDNVLDEIEVKQEYLLRSRSVYVLADASKVGPDCGGIVIADLRSLGALVTDAGVKGTAVAAMTQAGLRLVVAP